jgi:hypothetical protein
MTLTRLLAAALVLCALPAFTQDQQSQSSRPSTRLCEMRSNTGCISQSRMMMESFLGPSHAATPAEPWRFIPHEPAGLYSGHNPLSRFRIDQWEVYDGISMHDTKPPTYQRRPYSQGRPRRDADFACYAIRSYVVARDSKNSDSTHPVSYSTCQPAARYQLKTTEIRSGSADR